MNMTKLILPNNWNDIYCWQLIELDEIFNVKDEFEDDIDFVIEQLSVLANVPIEDDRLYKYTNSEIHRIFSHQLKFLTDDYLFKYNVAPKYFELDGVTYKKINLNDLTVSEWMTMDYFINEGSKLNFHNLIATMYRRVRTDEFGNEIMEKFEFDFEKRAEEFKQLPVTYAPVAEFINFKNECFKNFDLTNKIDDDEVDDTLLEDDEVEEKKEGAKAKYRRMEAERLAKLTKLFNWEKLLMDLTNNNINEAHQMLELPVLFLFRIITMKKNL